jgi:glycosyltransferase involved in cell wall biosynthesis
MNILFTNFHGRNGGGHVTYIVNLLQGLAAEHTLTVATPRSSRLFRLAQQVPGVKVVDMSFSTRPSSWLGPRAGLRKLIHDEAIDVIHANGSADHKQVMLAVLGMFNRPRIVYTKHNNHALDSLGHWLRARFATDYVIAVSDYVHDLLLHSSYHRCPIETIRHGLDTEYFAPVGSVEKFALRHSLIGPGLTDKILLGSAGGTDYEKGWLDLVAAVASLPQEQRTRFHLVVAGDAPNQAKLAQVAALGMTSQVSFPGLIDDVRPLLSACDVGFVLSYHEALSFACRELMALGLPVLITRVGGLPENLTDEKEGWIVPPKDPGAIAKVLLRMLDDPQCLQTMGQQARLRAASEFNLKDFVSHTLDVYQRTLEGRA